MSKSVICKQFNYQFMNLLKQLINVYPNLEQLKEYHVGLKLLLITNEKFLINIFDKYIIQYKDQIIEKDEKFFLDIDYSKYDDEDVTSQSQIFKEIWTSELTTEETKKNIWLYFNIFIKLIEKYNE